MRPLIDLKLGPMPRRPGTVEESLERYRTVAFGIEIMRDMIQADRINACVEAGPWFHGVVPECYRPAVLDAIARAFEPHRGVKLEERNVLALIDDINREIWATVEPIEPGFMRTHDD